MKSNNDYVLSFKYVFMEIDYVYLLYGVIFIIYINNRYVFFR